jgi:anti-anti-sigma factor
MILRARRNGGVLIFELEGQLDFETTQQFQETCESLIEKTATPRVVFNLDKLKFVGSSGINQFIRALKELNALDEKPKLCHLSPEFDRVFRAYQPTRNPFEIFADEGTAIAAFSLPKPARKTRKAVAPKNAVAKKVVKTKRGNA